MSRKTIYFDSYCGYAVAAVAEDGKITEFNFEKKDSVSIIGNIYKGRVESVLPGMNAAFVNCGLERNCYLSGDDIYPDAGKYDCESGQTPPFPELKEGDEIAVQVVKAPVGNKGAKVTPCFSFVGKHLIYMPDTPFIGVSRKIADEELRKNLIYSASRMKNKDEGVVLRTASPYAKRKQLENELEYLRNLHKSVKATTETAKVGQLIYTDLELPMRVMRDTLSYDIERIIVGNKSLEKLIRDLVSLYPPANRRPVLLHDTGRDMMGEYGLSRQVDELASPRVNLDNGAYLIIEETEALTVIDVNTGAFTGDDSLEQTVYYTNILAAREIARQVKLRNIGGIVIVDFIDMSVPSHRVSLVEELERALKKDSAKCSVSPMSRLGLVEFTRKRTGSSPLTQMTKPCRHCKGGKTLSTRYLLLGTRAKILDNYADGQRIIRIDMNSEIAETFGKWKTVKEDLKTRCPEAKIYLVPHRSYLENQIHLYCGAEAEIPENAVKLI